MEDQKNREDIVSYYDEHVKHKLNDYIKVSPRIEFGWKTILKYAPEKPVHILEVGCGMGNISSRMHRQWPNAFVTGMDISTSSIQLAKKLFESEKLKFKESILTPDTFTDQQFDLVVFMDVYEHIAVKDRPDVHAAVKKVLKNKGRVILTVPTPHNLKWSLVNKPETMQPVDEHISFDVIAKLASDTQTEVIFYELKSVWNTADYAHVVLERNNDFEAAFFHPKPVTAIERTERIMGKIKAKLGSYFRKAFVMRKLK